VLCNQKRRFWYGVEFGRGMKDYCPIKYGCMSDTRSETTDRRYLWLSYGMLCP
jgi:hypothetical protein